jgi:hypothetical protein
VLSAVETTSSPRSRSPRAAPSESPSSPSIFPPTSTGRRSSAGSARDRVRAGRTGFGGFRQKPTYLAATAAEALGRIGGTEAEQAILAALAKLGNFQATVRNGIDLLNHKLGREQVSPDGGASE